ncbi:MAG: Rv1355c family protein, partial [Kofleriaceae bacterium]|nr:Rv1355c family protein [Kofleriaceae bacterium]
AREMFEIDPYIEIDLFSDGLTQENMADFFDGKLDLVVDECDDLFAKVRIRECAKEHGIAVLMDTSDGGLLDIERFDLEPSRPIFHGVLPHLRAEDLVGLSTKDKIPFVLAILGIEEMSGQLAGSLIEIDKTLSTWPQLGSAVTLGGALIAHSARSVFLDSNSSSGRFRIDLDKLISTGQESPVSIPVVSKVSANALHLPKAPKAPTFSKVDEQFVRYLISFAIRAPSGGNAQPWKFVWRSPELHCSIDKTRASFLDFEGSASKLALGAAVENIVLAAANSGVRTIIQYPDDPSCECILRFEQHNNPSLPNQDIFRHIFSRATNRNLGNKATMSSHEIDILRSAAQQAGGSVRVVTGDEDIVTIGKLLGQCDKLRFLSSRMHTELVSELRWTLEQVESTKDGIDLETLELPPADRAILKVLSRSDIPTFLNRIGGGTAIGDGSIKANAHASSMLLVTVPKGEAQDFRGGRCMQSVWLAATSLQLAIWPQGVPFFLLRQARSEKSQLTNAESKELIALGGALEKCMKVGSDDHVTMLFRCSHSPPPSAFALRRSIDDVYSA